MKKNIEKIYNDLEVIKNKFPEIEEGIKNRKGDEIIIPKIDFSRNIKTNSKEMVEFIEKFYGLRVVLKNKKDIKKRKISKFELLPNEIFKEFENGFKVSNLGRVINNKNRLLPIKKNLSGYSYVNIKRKKYLIHILVATNFIKKYSTKKKYILHKDGNKENNEQTNLKWVEDSPLKRLGYKPGKSLGCIYKYSLEGEFIEKYKDTVEASKLSGVNQSNLAKYLSSSNGERVKYKNYYWERHP